MDPTLTPGFSAPSAPPLLCERRNAVRKGWIRPGVGVGWCLCMLSREWEGHANYFIYIDRPVSMERRTLR